MNKEKLLYQRWSVELEVVMTETHKDVGLGIKGWKVISRLCKQRHFTVIHRCDNLHCSLHSTSKNASNINSKLQALWCQKKGSNASGKWMGCTTGEALLRKRVCPQCLQLGSNASRDRNPHQTEIWYYLRDVAQGKARALGIWQKRWYFRRKPGCEDQDHGKALWLLQG